MDPLAALVNAGSQGSADHVDAVAEAMACLERFTAAFNACNVAAMDAELHFPHSMLSAEGEQHVWSRPGAHPANLFATLQEAGWSFTQYERCSPVLATPNKVHFVVHYTRRTADGKVMSEHHNLWVVLRAQGRWGIVWRSY